MLETVLTIVVGVSCFIIGRITAPSDSWEDGYDEGFQAGLPYSRGEED